MEGRDGARSLDKDVGKPDKSWEREKVMIKMVSGNGRGGGCHRFSWGRGGIEVGWGSWTTEEYIRAVNKLQINVTKRRE